MEGVDPPAIPPPSKHRRRKQRRRANRHLRVETVKQCDSQLLPTPTDNAPPAATATANAPPAATANTTCSTQTQTDLAIDVSHSEALASAQAREHFQTRAEEAEHRVAEQERVIALLKQQIASHRRQNESQSNSIASCKKKLAGQAQEMFAQKRRLDTAQKKQVEQEHLGEQLQQEIMSKTQENSILQEMVQTPPTPPPACNLAYREHEYVHFYEDKLAEAWRVGRLLHPPVDRAGLPVYPATDIAQWAKCLPGEVRTKAGDKAWAKIDSCATRLDDYVERRTTLRSRLDLIGRQGSEDMLGLSQISAVGEIREDIEELLRQRSGYREDDSMRGEDDIVSGNWRTKCCDA
ncbi:hypothetical protein LTR08_007868 [Meristemomyces frigidus]|nr:hypothetical protein LTR08_007868 [Meristemomyces frigidus]